MTRLMAAVGVLAVASAPSTHAQTPGKASPGMPEVPLVPLPVKKQEQPRASAPASPQSAPPSPEATPAAPSPSPAAGPGTTGRGWLAERGLAAGVRAALLLPTARVPLSYGFSLELAYAPPVWDRIAVLVVEGGWYPLQGSGVGAFTDFENTASGIERATTPYQYDWRIRALPLAVGGRVRLGRLLRLPESVEVGAGVGYTVVFAEASADFALPGEPPFSVGNTSRDAAHGFYLAAQGGVRLGPGVLFGEYRYTMARLDFYLPLYNVLWGDIGGNKFQVGYRLGL